MTDTPRSDAARTDPASRRGAPAAGRELDASKVDVWLFDLDNTLYPAGNSVFDQIDLRMGAYIQRLLKLDAEAAKALQKRYFQDHGTTLRGLMENHDADPAAYLDYVHEIDLTCLQADPDLDRCLGALPGRKLIFTNASTAHAHRVMERLGVARHFEAVFDIEGAEFRPKPALEAYQKLLARHVMDPSRVVFVEDSVRNLEPAAALGMTTVWVKSDTRWAGDGHSAPYVDHVVEDLGAWLSGLVAAVADAPERR